MSRLVLSGIVSSDNDIEVYRFFGMPAFSPAMLRTAIEETASDDVLTLEVNSPGGDAFAGVEMASSGCTGSYTRHCSELCSFSRFFSDFGSR